MASIFSTTGFRLKPKKPLDVWSTREKLCLASAVFKIGDQNWVSVSRAIKPYAEPNRPPEWFHQKNCVLQYYDLMEQLEQPKRKRGGDNKSETETPSLQIMRKMTIERSEQLKKEILEMQQQFKSLKSEVEEIKAGQWDDRIKDIWENIQKEEEKAAKEQIKVEAYDDDDARQSDIPGLTNIMGEIDDSTQDSVSDSVDISALTDEEGAQLGSSTSFLTSTPTVSHSSTSNLTKLTTASHLLSSLLKSEVTTATGLQQLKREQEQVQDLTGSGQSLLTPLHRSLLKLPVTQDDPLTTPPSSSAPTLSRLLSPAKEQTTTVATADLSPLTTASAGVETLIEEPVLDIQSDILSVSSGHCASVQRDLGEEFGSVPTLVEGVEEEVVEESFVSRDIEDSQGLNQLKTTLDTELSSIKDEPDKDSQDEEDDHSKKHGDATSEMDPADSFVKDEPLSPTSSISSRLSESGRGNRRGRPPSSRISRFSIRKSYTTDEDKKDDGSSRHSDFELSEDEVRESHDLISGHITSVNASSILSESFPNSPASLSICSDTEEEKSFKQWKKSIMLVWRAAATHKYANVFLHPVTNDIAPGYRSVVLRPMDLSTIKKNVETGITRTTGEFQRDMMLMFTNAIMYNSSDHNVYRMAVEMFDDVMRHLEQYVNTQIMMQTSDGKTLRQSRRPDASDKEDDSKKRRPSVDQGETGGKTKKRKTRLDESLDRS